MNELKPRKFQKILNDLEENKITTLSLSEYSTIPDQKKLLEALRLNSSLNPEDKEECIKLCSSEYEYGTPEEYEAAKLSIYWSRTPKTTQEVLEEKEPNQKLQDALSEDQINFPNVLELIREGADPFSKNDFGWNIVAILIVENDLPQLMEIIDIAYYQDVVTYGDIADMMEVAAKTGNMEIVNFLLKKLKPEEQEIENGDYGKVLSLSGEALAIAIQEKNFPMVKFLVENGVYLECQQHRERYPIFTAFKSGSVEIINYLMELDAEFVRLNPKSIKESDAQKSTEKKYYHCDATYEEFFLIAAGNGNIDAVKYLVEGGNVDANYKIENEELILLIAAQNNHIEIIKYLIAKNVDVNQKIENYYDSKAFFDSYIQIDNYQTTDEEISTETSADDVPDNDIQTKRHLKYIQYFIYSTNKEYRYYKYYRAKDWYNYITLPIYEKATALHIAAYKGHFEIVKSLISGGAEIDDTSDRELTALHLATQEGHLEIVVHLLDCGADIHKKTDDDNSTAIHIAAQKGHFEILKLLVARGADVNQKTLEEYISPLHIAAAKGRKDMVEYLIANGADINAQTVDGLTALDIALHNDHQEIVEIIEKEKAKIAEAELVEEVAISSHISTNKKATEPEAEYQKQQQNFEQDRDRQEQINAENARRLASIEERLSKTQEAQFKEKESSTSNAEAPSPRIGLSKKEKTTLEDIFRNYALAGEFASTKSTAKFYLQEDGDLKGQEKINQRIEEIKNNPLLKNFFTDIKYYLNEIFTATMVADIMGVNRKAMVGSNAVDYAATFASFAIDELPGGSVINFAIQSLASYYPDHQFANNLKKITRLCGDGGFDLQVLIENLAIEITGIFEEEQKKGSEQQFEKQKFSKIFTKAKQKVAKEIKKLSPNNFDIEPKLSEINPQAAFYGTKLIAAIFKSSNEEQKTRAEINRKTVDDLTSKLRSELGLEPAKASKEDFEEELREKVLARKNAVPSNISSPRTQRIEELEAKTSYQEEIIRSQQAIIEQQQKTIESLQARLSRLEQLLIPQAASQTTTPRFTIPTTNPEVLERTKSFTDDLLKKQQKLDSARLARQNSQAEIPQTSPRKPESLSLKPKQTSAEING